MRPKVSRLEELLQWAEACAAKHQIEPPYLGGSTTASQPDAVPNDAEADDSSDDERLSTPAKGPQRDEEDVACDPSDELYPREDEDEFPW